MPGAALPAPGSPWTAGYRRTQQDRHRNSNAYDVHERQHRGCEATHGKEVYIGATTTMMRTGGSNDGDRDGLYLARLATTMMVTSEKYDGPW